MSDIFSFFFLFMKQTEYQHLVEIMLALASIEVFSSWFFFWILSHSLFLCVYFSSEVQFFFFHFFIFFFCLCVSASPIAFVITSFASSFSLFISYKFIFVRSFFFFSFLVMEAFMLFFFSLLSAYLLNTVTIEVNIQCAHILFLVFLRSFYFVCFENVSFGHVQLFDCICVWQFEETTLKILFFLSFHSDFVVLVLLFQGIWDETNEMKKR